MIPSKEQLAALSEAVAAEEERTRQASLVMEAEAKLAARRRDMETAQKRVELARRRLRDVAAEIVATPADRVDIQG